MKGGAFGHSQKVRLRVYLTVLSWVVVSALSLKTRHCNGSEPKS